MTAAERREGLLLVAVCLFMASLATYQAIVYTPVEPIQRIDFLFMIAGLLLLWWVTR